MSWRALWPVLALALIALIPTGKFIFGDLVPAPVDQIHLLPPWNGPTPESDWDTLQIDGALQFLPWRDFMLDSMRAGWVPLWNPHTLGGTPFLANSQSAPLYPLHWLWPLDAESLLGFSAWLHIFVGGLGTYILCRRLGGNELGGIIGGTAFQLSAFLVSWIQLPSVGMTASWIPWCLLGVLRLYEEPSARSVAKLAISIGLLLLAGHIQIAVYGLVAAGLYGLWLITFAVFRRSKDIGKILVAGGAALLIGLSMAAPQVVPSVQNALNGHRVSAASEASWQAHKGQALHSNHLLTLFIPQFFGMPHDAESFGPILTGYWLAYQEPGRNYAELALYVGPVVLPLAIFSFVAWWRRPELAFFGLLTAFGLLIALGTLADKALYFSLPGWSATGSPGRAAILVALGLCTLAGAFIRDHAERPSRLGILSAAGAVLLALAGAYAVRQAIPPQIAEAFGLPSLIPIAAFAISLVLFLLRGAAAAAVLAVAQIVILGVTHRAINPGSERGLFDREFAGLEQLQGKSIAVVNKQWFLLGLPLNQNSVAPPNSLLPYNITEIGGYDSIIPRPTKERLDEVNGQDSAPRANGNMMLIKPIFEPLKARQAGAEYAMSAFPLDLEVVYEGAGWNLYRLPGEDPRSFVKSEGYTQKVLSWAGAGREQTRNWLNSPAGDGWEMSFPSYDYKAGTVTATYSPHSYRAGFLVALFGISAAVALSCVRSRRDESQTGTENPRP
ncbi:MAG: hypothetical protein ACR2HJ_12350 [Fimbriimonadales bacterium]